MANIIEARVKQKKDTLENWEANPMIILDGEQAFVVSDSGQPINFKIGDGTKRFSDLPFWIDYAGGQYIELSGNVLPTPTVDVGYTFVGPGTYTHPGQPDIVAPDGRFSQIVWNGTSWSLKDMGELPTVDTSNLLEKGGYAGTAQQLDFDKIDKEELLDYNQPTLIEGFVENKLWDITNYNNGQTGDSANASSVSNIISVEAGQTVFFYNLNPNTLALATLFRVYDNDTGDYIQNIAPALLTNVSNDIKSYTFSVARKIGVMVQNSNKDSVIIGISENPVYPTVKENLLPTTLAKKSETVSQVELFDTVDYEVGDLAPFEFLAGYYHSTSTRLSDELRDPGVNNALSTNPIVLGTPRILIVENMVTPPVSTWGKVVDNLGNFVRNLVQADFENLGNNRLGLVVEQESAVSVLFTVLGVDQPDFKVFYAKGINVIKPELLPQSANSEMYLRGLNRAKFDTGSYGIVASGQSNEEGREELENLPSGFSSELTNVKLFNRSSSAFANIQLGANMGGSNNADTRWGYDWIVFKLLADYLSQDIYVLKRTYGGTPLAADTTLSSGNRTLNAKYETIVPQTATMVTKQFEQNILSSFRVAETNSINVVYKAFLWMQGEGDANFAKWENEYYQNLTDYISYMRGIFGNPTMVFVIVTMHKDSAQYSQVVRDAQIKAGGKRFKWNGTSIQETKLSGDPFVWVYDIDGHPWTSIGDNLHMNAQLNLLVGTDVFNMIKDL